MSSPELGRTTSQEDIESGYASASSENGGFTELYFTKPHLKFLNKQLNQLEPEGMYTVKYKNILGLIPIQKSSNGR